MSRRETFSAIPKINDAERPFPRTPRRESSKDDRPTAFTRERLIPADTIIVHGQALWDDLAAALSDDMCPAVGNNPWPIPPCPSMWLEAAAAEWDGETHRIHREEIRWRSTPHDTI